MDSHCNDDVEYPMCNRAPNHIMLMNNHVLLKDKQVQINAYSLHLLYKINK